MSILLMSIEQHNNKDTPNTRPRTPSKITCSAVGARKRKKNAAVKLRRLRRGTIRTRHSNIIARPEPYYI